MITIMFDSEIQLTIFLNLINNPKGLSRKEIVKNTNIPRTTVFDNLTKLSNRKIKIINKLLEIPYVNFYHSWHGIGRPKTIWFVPKAIKEQFLSFDIPNVIVNHELLNKW